MFDHRHHCLDSSNRLPATRVPKAGGCRECFPPILRAPLLRQCGRRTTRAAIFAGASLLGLLAGCDAGQVTTDNRSAIPGVEISTTTPETNTRPALPAGNITPAGGVTPATTVSLTTAANARQWLDAVIDRYRQAIKYFDNGYVRLVYRRLGERHEDTAPLAVAFHRGRSLQVKAYAAELLASGGRFQAIVNDPLTDNFDNQVVDRPLASKNISLAEIYADPELTHFATAGLGGPAPQLELLLSEKPLAGLFEGSAKLSVGKVETLQTAGASGETPRTSTCQTLEITTDSMVYRLWIDTQTGLLRRIELPPEAAGLGIDPAVTDVRLTIEIVGAQFELPRGESFQLPRERLTGTGIKRVRTLVPLPPPIISESLGRSFPDFKLLGPDGGLLVSEQGSDRPTTVMLWIADHPASRMAAAQLQIVADAREAAGKKDARILVVMAEPRLGSDTLVAPGGGGFTGNLLRSWNIGLPFANDVKAVGRDIFKVAEAPTLAVIGPSRVLDWFQPRVGPEIAVQLPLLLEDLAGGKEVGKEIRSQYEADQQTYKKLLAEAAPKP